MPFVERESPAVLVPPQAVPASTSDSLEALIQQMGDRELDAKSDGQAAQSDEKHAALRALVVDHFDRACLSDAVSVQKLQVLFSEEKKTPELIEVAAKLFAKYSAEAEAGDVKAMVALGIAHTNGLYLSKDKKSAIHWFRRAHDLDDPSGVRWFARCLAVGEGCEKDGKRAFALYQKAAAAGNPAAVRGIGWCYDTGCGVEVDYKQALHWYHRAVELKDVPAMRNIGIMYELGNGVEKSAKASLEWCVRTRACLSARVLACLLTCLMRRLVVSVLLARGFRACSIALPRSQVSEIGRR